MSHTKKNIQNTQGLIDWHTHINIYKYHLLCAHSSCLLLHWMNNLLILKIYFIEFHNVFAFQKRSFIKRQTSGTKSDNERQRMTTSDNEWYNKWQRMTTSDNEWYNEWQRMTTSDNEWYNEWQRMTTSDNEWYNKWQRMTTSDNEWQRVTTSGTTNDNEWKWVTKSDNE